ncbi:phosphate/phosphite/phosphonate ABC transporter substrate-binding protein [Pelagibius sp.]|uniref:phosphate/phosphite/phosphonate ABC transporter substrate-binding protein n=1 Tax=Pelagibius sp. TaxID=1931238 RepID=UPI003BB0E3A6
MLSASLPMYDLPALRKETDAWWAALAAAFRAEGLKDVPDSLARSDEPAALWLSSDLLFSQTCGYPLTHSLKGKVTLLMTPVYDLEGCAGGTYYSEILVRRDADFQGLADLRGKRAAVNEAGSQSGYNVLRSAIAPLAKQGRFFAAVEESGSHRNSMAMVASGDADVCAVDCVTYGLLCKAEPEAAVGLRRLVVSASAPALPFITRRDIPEADLQRLRGGLRSAFDDPALADIRAALLLTDVVTRPLGDYAVIEAMETQAVSLGYPTLA